MAHENCGCNDYTRSQALRSAAAEAGRGLPSIEAGMPSPAGTGLSRRSFLLRGTGLVLAVYGATKLPFKAFEEGIAQAATNGKIIVSIFFDGGLDSLSMLAPVGHSKYATLRPTLALPPGAGTPFAEDTSLHWHPKASKLATLHGEGKVTVMPAIGYTDADQSHFTSRHYWEIGELQVGARTGWLGRYIDQTGADDNPLQGLSLDWSLSPMLATADKPIAAVERVGSYDMWSWAGGVDAVEDPMFESFKAFGSHSSDSPGMTQVRRATYQTARLREQLLAFDDYEVPATYPEDSNLGERLSGLVELIKAGLPLSCVTVPATGGYDTHSDQANDLPGNIEDTCEAVYAFQRDLEANGLADRVLIEMWSEFGRRPEENGSGTDHGAAGCAFVIGTKSKGQMVGSFPGLNNLDEDDNLIHTSDFREMYCSLLEQWLGTDANGIIPGASSMGRPVLVKP